MHTWFDAQLDQKILDGLYFEAVYSLSYSTSDFAFLFAPTHSAAREALPNFCLTQEKIFYYVVGLV